MTFNTQQPDGFSGRRPMHPVLCWQVQSHPGMQGVLKHFGCGLRALCARHVFNHVGAQQHVRRVRGWQVQLSSQHPRGLYLCPVYKRDILACWCCQLHCVPCGDLRGRFGQRVYDLPCWEVRFEWGQRLHRLLRVRDRPVQRVQLHCFGGYRVWYVYHAHSLWKSQPVHLLRHWIQWSQLMPWLLQTGFQLPSEWLLVLQLHEMVFVWHNECLSCKLRQCSSSQLRPNNLQMQCWLRRKWWLERHVAGLSYWNPNTTPCQLVWCEL